MNGPFERYGEIHQIKQQLHVRELQMNGQLKRQRTNLYKMNQTGDENWEQLKFTFNAWRGWIKSKAKPKKMETVAEAGTESDSVYTEGNEAEAEGMRQVKNASEAERMRQAMDISESGNLQQMNYASGAEGVQNRNIVPEPGKLQSAEEFRRAVLWAEILGEPAAKRRRAGRAGNQEGRIR